MGTFMPFSRPRVATLKAAALALVVPRFMCSPMFQMSLKTMSRKLQASGCAQALAMHASDVMVPVSSTCTQALPF